MSMPGAAQQQVAAEAAVEHVVAGAAVEQVRAGAAREAVVAAAAGEVLDVAVDQVGLADFAVVGQAVEVEGTPAAVRVA